MAITVTESKGSRSFVNAASEKTLERIFFVKGTDDPIEAENVGPQIGEMYNDELRVVERHVTVLKPAGAGTEGGMLQLNVMYRFRVVLEPGNVPTYEINVGTASERIFQTPAKMSTGGVIYEALTQRHYGGDDKNEPGNLIVVTEDKNGQSVEGVDALSPTIELTETHQRSSMPAHYVRTLVRLTAKVNKASWRGWNSQTLLFTGFRAFKRKGEYWNVTYYFRAGLNGTFVLVGDDGTIEFSKTAHEYAWFRRSETQDGTTLVSKIHDVHVAPIYHLANFGGLGLGSNPLE